MGSMRWVAIVACTWLASSAAWAQVELKNDGFQAGAQVGFQDGFCAAEAGAARFVAPAAGRQLLKVRFLFGATATTHTVALTVWDDTAGTTMPGTVLFSADYQVTGSPDGMIETDLSAESIVLPQQFRIGVVLQHAGQPSIARDSDGTLAADKNYVLADAACGAGGPYTWFRSQTIGLIGDWVIRAEISATGGGPTDAGPGTDAPPGTGDPCTGNPQCPLGQYCDLDFQTCTYDCTNDGDCGAGACNSLGQCLPATGDGGGCGCEARGGDALAGGLLLLGLAWVGRRRRR